MIDYNATQNDISIAGQLLAEQFTYGSYPSVDYLKKTSPNDPDFSEDPNKSWVKKADFAANVNLQPTIEQMTEFGLDWQEGHVIISTAAYILQTKYIGGAFNVAPVRLYDILSNDDLLEVSSVKDIDGTPCRYSIKQILNNSWIGTAPLKVHFLCVKQPAGNR